MQCSKFYSMQTVTGNSSYKSFLSAQFHLPDVINIVTPLCLVPSENGYALRASPSNLNLKFQMLLCRPPTQQNNNCTVHVDYVSILL